MSPTKKEIKKEIQKDNEYNGYQFDDDELDEIIEQICEEIDIILDDDEEGK